MRLVGNLFFQSDQNFRQDEKVPECRDCVIEGTRIEDFLQLVFKEAELVSPVANRKLQCFAPVESCPAP